MPIFEYLCQDCGTRFEKLLRASDSGEVLCPSCGKNRSERQLSTFAAHSGGGHADGPSCPNAGGCPSAGMCGMN